jgi:hypothetical protein
VVRYNGQTGSDPSPSLVPTNLSSGALLSYAQLASFAPSATPISATPDRTYGMALAPLMVNGAMNWAINGQLFPNVTPMTVAQGDIVQVNLVNQTMSSMHLHPMHLHGHAVRLMGTAGGTTHPPVKDTVLMYRSGQAGSSWSLQFTADNPGRWLYHCHDMMHMASGMMTLVDYLGDADGDGIADAADMEPRSGVPVLTVPADAAAFWNGASGSFQLQGQPGQMAFLYVALTEAAVPIALPPYGRVDIDPATAAFLSSGVALPSGVIPLPYALPADPLLVGVRLVLQGFAASPLPGGARLSTAQAITIR